MVMAGLMANKEETRLRIGRISRPVVDGQPRIELHLVHVLLDDLGALGTARQSGPFCRTSASSKVPQNGRCPFIMTRRLVAVPFTGWRLRLTGQEKEPSASDPPLKGSFH